MTLSVKRAPRRARALSLLCLIFLIVPNFNIIDLLPDFVAYIILARFFGKCADYAPYFAEAREAFSRLAIVSALKIPGLVVMMMNIGSGMDIVPLFTLVFSAFELALLFPAITNAFYAIFYLGERGKLDAGIKPFGYMGKRIAHPDSARMLSYIFVSVKCALTFIPDMFLLTHATDTTEEMLSAIFVRSMFPIATVICMLSVLVLGIFWAKMLHKYAMAIAADGGVLDAAISVAGEARLRELEGERGVKRLLRLMTILTISALLCFDVTFASVNDGVNMLPHFLYAILIVAIGHSVCESKQAERLLLGGGLVYSAVSIAAHMLLSSFNKNHYYSDLGNIAAADRAYLYVEIATVAELIFFAIFISIWARALVKFILGHTTLKLSDERFCPTDAEFVRKTRRKAYIFTYFPLFIALLKCAETFIRADVRYILPGTTSEADVSTIVTSSVPWFGFLVLGVSIAYAFYAYYFMNEVKDEIKMKYSNEKHSFE